MSIYEKRHIFAAAQAMWILLILFTIVYVAKEATKAIHLRLRYLWEYESWLNVAIILSFPLISFHSNPFSSTHLTIQRYKSNQFQDFFSRKSFF